MISIIIPVYNAELYIEECVESILVQTYGDFELLLIDNGSIDNSFALCQELTRKDSRIKAFREEVNQGVSVARNQGIGIAAGEYITFVDADDWLEPDCLQQMIIASEQYECPLVMCKYRKSVEADRTNFFSRLAEERHTTEEKEKEERQVGATKLYPVEDFMKKLFFLGNTHCWGVLYKTTLLQQENILFPRGLSIGEDMLFFAECLLKGKQIAVIETVGYHYFINEKGAMERKFQRSYMDQITCWQQAKDRLLPSFPQLKDRLESVILVSVMLVVGKLAQLPKQERKTYEKELQRCKNVLLEYYDNRELYPFLPAGYNWKIRLFKNIPSFYMTVYGLLKK